MTMSNILILGHGGHGKGTFCKMLEEIHGIKSMSSSQAALPYIFESLNAALNDRVAPWDQGTKPFYANEQVAFADRHRHRHLWRCLISLLNSPDKKTLTRLILSQVPAYDGMRCHLEFESSESEFDMIFWIDASRRLPPDPSMSIAWKMGMINIDNNYNDDGAFMRAQVEKLRFPK